MHKRSEVEPALRVAQLIEIKSRFAASHFVKDYANAGAWHQYTDPIERVNAFIRYRLLARAVPIEIRGHLFPSGDLEAWLVNLEAEIIPALVDAYKGGYQNVKSQKR